MDIRLRDKAKDHRPFIQAQKLLEEVLADKQLNESAVSMEAKVKVFDKLQEALRIVLPTIIWDRHMIGLCNNQVNFS